MPDEDFYWQTARDSLLTDVAVQLFQIAMTHDGEEFDTAKSEIDDEYALLRGQPSERHGGKFQTAVLAYQEAGWIDIADGHLRITDAGKQAVALLSAVPDFLKAAPQFVVELLARYQLNNPARPPVRNDAIAELRARSNVFPYWTIWKIMRSCDNTIRVDELRRFVFRLSRSEDIDETISMINSFRVDKESMTQAELDARYPSEIAGANGEPKYWMARAGTQIGHRPPLIEKPNPTTYVLNDSYLPFIDSVLNNEPIFSDYLTEETWMQHYGELVDISSSESGGSGIRSMIDVDDPLAIEVELLLSTGSKSFLLTGPPGTSKSWYARQLAFRILDGDTSRLRLVQFHPSYGYEDFIEGFIPEVAPTGGLPNFILKWKVFAEVCDLAREGEPAVLIIDEFSRGDAGRIFGEALTYIEPDYRNASFRLASGRDFSVPENLIIIATMNPYDRSVTAVDVAMQRRFSILRMMPSVDILLSILARNGMTEDLVGRVVAFFQDCQEVIPHGGLGHAYFLNSSDIDSLMLTWKYQLLPLFEQELQFEPDALQRITGAFAALIRQ